MVGVEGGEDGHGVAPQTPTVGRRAAAVAIAVATTTLVCLGSELAAVPAGGADWTALATITGFYLATSGVITAFAVWTAEDLRLPSLLWLAPGGRRQKLIRLLVYGVGLGLLLSVASILLAGDSGSGLRPWYWRRIQTPVESVLFAARAAFLEETFFRLFLIPLLVSLAVRVRPPRYRFRLREGTLKATRERTRSASTPVVLGAVVVSSLLFGLAHRFNPVSAAILAPVLAVAYLRGGWESAVLAHLLANFLVFSVYF